MTICPERKTLIVAAAIVALAASAVNTVDAANTNNSTDEANGADNANCKPAPETYDIAISGNSGKILPGGDTYWPRNRAMAYVIQHENPFRYVYSHAVEFEPLDQNDAITRFLKLLSPLGFLFESSEDTKGEIEEQVKSMSKSLAEPKACSGSDLDTLRSIKERMDAERDYRKQLEQSITNTRSSYESLQKESLQFAADHVSPEVANCAEATRAAVTLKGSAQSFSLRNLPNRLAVHETRLDRIQSDLTEFKSENALCAVRKVVLLDTVAGLQQQAANMAEAVTELQSKKAEVDQLVGFIDSALNNGFYATGVIPAKRVPGKATVKVSRQLRQPTGSSKETRDIEITIGGPFFTLSAGIGGSTIDELEFGKVDSNVPDGMGGEMLGQRIAVLDDSSPSVLGAVLLHGNLTRFQIPNTGLYPTLALSLGVTIGDDDQASAFGYLAGVSLGALNDQLYVTAGYHVRDVDRLAGGFAVGDVVPAGLENIPTTKKSDEGFMLLFTVKFQ